MLVVFWVVPAEKRPSALAKFSMDVSGFVEQRIFAHDQNIGSNQRVPVGRGLSHESFDGAGVVLTQYAWNQVPLGRIIEQRE